MRAKQLGITIIAATSYNVVVKSEKYKDCHKTQNVVDILEELHKHRKVLLNVDVVLGLTLTVWLQLLAQLQPNPTLRRKELVIPTEKSINFLIQHFSSLGLDDSVEFHECVDIVSKI